jgi:DNA polymerase III epsilon subunit-like protein
MKYVSIDLETTGLDPGNCQVLEIGAVAQELGGEELDRFHAFLYYKTLTGTPFALNLNQRILHAIIGGEGLNPHRAWGAFYNWLEKYTNDRVVHGKVVVAGKNFATFDLPFIEVAAPHVAKQFFRRILDPAILYMRLADPLPPDLATCLARAGLSDEVSHNAVDDAAQVRDLIEYHFKGKVGHDATQDREAVGT